VGGFTFPGPISLIGLRGFGGGFGLGFGLGFLPFADMVILCSFLVFLSISQ